MNNFSLNKYHTYIFFGLSVIFAYINFTLDLEYISIICFFLISTRGVSDGALDHETGKNIITGFKSISFRCSLNSKAKKDNFDAVSHNFSKEYFFDPR